MKPSGKNSKMNEIYYGKVRGEPIYFKTEMDMNLYKKRHKCLVYKL